MGINSAVLESVLTIVLCDVLCDVSRKSKIFFVVVVVFISFFISWMLIDVKLGLGMMRFRWVLRMGGIGSLQLYM